MPRIDFKNLIVLPKDQSYPIEMVVKAVFFQVANGVELEISYPRVLRFETAERPLSIMLSFGDQEILFNNEMMLYASAYDPEVLGYEESKKGIFYEW